MTTPTADVAEIARGLRVLVSPGGVVELRIPKTRNATISGYFRDMDRLAREAAKLSGRVTAVYVCLNPIDPRAYARAAERIEPHADTTTTDHDIIRRHWLLVDLDPKRPAGVSSMDTEHAVALRRARECYDWLLSLGFLKESLVLADSGNGGHVLIRLDLPNDTASTTLAKAMLAAISLRWSDNLVVVDQTTFNAGQIDKLYGTRAGKGDNIAEQPHRLARLLVVPAEVRPASVAVLKQLAVEAPKEPPRPHRFLAGGFDLEPWLAERLPAPAYVTNWNGGKLWKYHVCPWNSAHTDRSFYVIRFASGAIVARCHHNGCAGNDWRALQDLLEPGWQQRRGTPTQEPTAPRQPASPGLVALASVRPERVRWLWPGRLPLGKVSIIDGDPGLGKSVLTLDLAARVTTGRAMPDGATSDLAEPAGVLLLSAEDGLADTIRPRLEAAEADLARVAAMTSVADVDGTERLPVLPDDIPTIEAAIVQTKAKLVVIDPLMAFLGGQVSAHRDQDVRRAMAPLAAMAERTGAAVVVVRHLNKAAGIDPLYRGGGSIGIIGAARSGLLVAKDPDDAERRILAVVKANLAAPAPALAYRIVPGEPDIMIQWEGQTAHTAAQLLAIPDQPEERSAMAEAVDFLRDLLTDGAKPAKDVQQQARAAGIAERTLWRARAGARVRARKVGFGEDGVWHWELLTPAEYPEDTAKAAKAAKAANPVGVAALRDAGSLSVTNDAIPPVSRNGAAKNGTLHAPTMEVWEPTSDGWEEFPADTGDTRYVAVNGLEYCAELGGKRYARWLPEQPEEETR